ncbi:MAG: glycine--tRNA ligase [Austwickia sp.]|nr:glycine--tRNA ligase [Austwickia sp.]
MQDALRILSEYWTERGAMVVQPFNTEVGAGTMNPATILRVLGPEPWRVAYVEPSVRPDDSRYGENPNRLQTHTQFQVILKPDPGDPQELYLGSLEALGIDLRAHDVRFVEDNWAQPAIGAWGLGWEVWLDGMEITQFTYFQQVGGLNLDPVAVELTYGMERILMAEQGVTHFKDIVYAQLPDRTITYGEAFGQSEYEMSVYYLDAADVEANRRLFETYTAEAARLIEARLPVPAHTYVLKSSHAFNVLDSRGAISTTQRAQAFATMRRLAREVCSLWVARREELEFPLGRSAVPVAAAPEPVPAKLPSTPQMLALEIGLEELPPHVVTETIEQVRAAVTAQLATATLPHGEIFVDGTPRRIVVTIADVAAVEPDALRLTKGPKWSAAFDASGGPTKALEGFLRGQKASVEAVVKAQIGGNEHVAIEYTQTGRPVLEVAAKLIAEVVGGLRAEKNMRWSDPELSFSRAIRWLVALWGPVVVPVQVGALTAGRTTYLQRTDDRPWIEVATADELVSTIGTRVTLETAQRRLSVIEQATALAAGVGGAIEVEAEAALIDEITNLVEDPHGVLGSFDHRYLELPEQILTTVMRKHQRYLPVRGEDGRLLPHFVTMANGACDDAVVRAGNESVLRARYEDALFFWNADLTASAAEDFLPGLEKLTFEERLGSVGLRARRIADVARLLAERVGLAGQELETLTRAGRLAKFDLASQMVVELSSLAGFIGREYAVRLGESAQVADAIYQMEQPRTTADAVPAGTPGALLALADRFDLLMGMFALGAKPTGSSDPFGLRRAALGIVRILRERPELTLSVQDGLDAAAQRLRDQGVEVSPEAQAAALEFAVGRFAQSLRDEGVPMALVTAVLPSGGAPGRAAAYLGELGELRSDAEFAALVAALVRIGRIVPAGTPAGYDASLLTQPAETALMAAVSAAVSEGGPAEGVAGYLPGAHGLAAAVNRFFDDILVMDPDPQVRAARLGLLASVLVGAPAGIDWQAADTWLAL